MNRLLDLTLRSVLAQTDRDFRVVLAGHEPSPAWLAVATGDDRFTFLRADWAPEAPKSANDDGGHKKSLITDHVSKRGGGLLMFLDADDWVDRELVCVARAQMGAGVVAALIDHGYAFDLHSGRRRGFRLRVGSRARSISCAA